MRSRLVGCIDANWVIFISAQRYANGSLGGGGGGRSEGTNLFLFGFGDHVICHVPNGFVDDFRHGGHDTLRLFSFETFTLEALDKVMCVKVEVAAFGGIAEGACVY